MGVISLAAGAGSRWTQGMRRGEGALHPFCKLGGRHRTFLEVHLAKSRRVGRIAGATVPHVITTSYLTHGAIERFLADHDRYAYPGPLHLSEGLDRPAARADDARPSLHVGGDAPALLDEQAQKMRESGREALIRWAQSAGEASDYTDNVPSQCLHPVGHWFEVPNLLRNGTLARMLAERPGLRYLMLHNIDTVGTDLDAAPSGCTSPKARR